MDDPLRVKVEVEKFFEERFKEREKARPKLDGACFNKLSRG